MRYSKVYSKLGGVRTKTKISPSSQVTRKKKSNRNLPSRPCGYLVVGMLNARSPIKSERFSGMTKDKVGQYLSIGQ
jgi:hypothetical protein